MLEKEPEERQASAEELLSELRAVETMDAPSVRIRRREIFAAAVLIVIIAISGFLVLRGKRPDPKPARQVLESKEQTLVVLPFQFTGTQPDSRAFSDGLIETVTAKLGALAVLHKFQIIPANEVRARHAVNVADARTEFGSDLVLEGDIQKSGESVRINYALVDAHSGRQMGSESITLPRTNSFEIQDNVVEGVARLLGFNLGSDERASLARNGTRTAGAYDFYLQGRGYLQNYDKPENLDNAISVFKQALNLDPNYALAYAGMGETYWKKYEATKNAQWVNVARDNCRHALALDDSAPGSHDCLATVESGTGNYEKAVLEFQNAIQRNPNEDAAYLGLAIAYERAGKADQAEQTYKRAIELRPQYWGSYSRLGAYYSSKGQYAEAEKMFAQVVALAPDSYRGFSNLGGVYFFEEKNPEAIAAFERSLAIKPNYTAASNLGTLYYYAGDYARAAANFDQALKIQASDYVVWGNLAAARTMLNDTEGARTADRRAIELARARIQVNPRDAKALVDLAGYYAALDEKPRALELIAKALGIRPDDAQLMMSVAIVYESGLGLREEALKYLKAAVEHGLSLKDVERSLVLKDLRADSRFKEVERAASSK